MASFLEECHKWQIKVECDYVLRVFLKGGDKTARKHFTEVIRNNPDFEDEIILELAKNNSDLRYWIEERAAIGECDIVRAIKQLTKHE